MKGYEPIDVVLSRPSVRMLRAMARFDGITSSDLYELLGVELGQQRDAYQTNLARLKRAGHVTGNELRYITQAGRDWLAKQLRRADVGVATDEEAMPHDAAEGA